MVLDHIEAIKKISELSGKKIVILFDRGYPSMWLMAKLRLNNIDFIIRCKKSYIKETDDASKYENYDNEKIISLSETLFLKLPGTEFLSLRAESLNEIYI